LYCIMAVAMRIFHSFACLCRSSPCTDFATGISQMGNGHG
jgi:hypothetical protein